MYRYKMLIAFCLLALHTHCTVAMDTSNPKKSNSNKNTLTRKKQPSQKKFVPKTQKVPNEKIQDEEVVGDITPTSEPKIETSAETIPTVETIITTIHTEETITEKPCIDSQTAAEKANMSTEAPTIHTAPVVTFTGLGWWSGLKDYIWKPGSNVISELKNKTFQADHPSNQGRVYSAIKDYTNTDNMNELALLFNLLAQLQPAYKVGNNEAMKVAYKYLKSQKVITIELNAQKIISQLVSNKQKNLQSKVDGYKTTFGSELPTLQNEIEETFLELQNTVASHLAAANTCKQARIDCLKLTTIHDDAGYDSDSEKPDQYSEEIFLKRPKVNLYTTVENFKSNLAENKVKLQSIQDQFSAIKLLPTIDDNIQ